MHLRAKTCCFTGHRSLSHEEKLKVAVRLRKIIEKQGSVKSYAQNCLRLW